MIRVNILGGSSFWVKDEDKIKKYRMLALRSKRVRITKEVKP